MGVFEISSGVAESIMEIKKQGSDVQWCLSVKEANTSQLSSRKPRDVSLGQPFWCSQLY